MNKFEIKFGTKKNHLTIIFIICWNLIVIYGLIANGNPILFLFLLIGSYLFYKVVLKQIACTLQISIDNSLFISETKFLGHTYNRNEYSIDKIKNVKIEKNVKEGGFWRIGSRDGISLKIYDITPIVLNFNYENKVITFGSPFHLTGIDKLVSELNLSRNKVKLTY